jgi:hypothetical protein
MVGNSRLIASTLRVIVGNSRLTRCTLRPMMGNPRLTGCTLRPIVGNSRRVYNTLILVDSPSTLKLAVQKLAALAHRHLLPMC